MEKVRQHYSCPYCGGETRNRSTRHKKSGMLTTYKVCERCGKAVQVELDPITREVIREIKAYERNSGQTNTGMQKYMQSLIQEEQPKPRIKLKLIQKPRETTTMINLETAPTQEESIEKLNKFFNL